jgi:hypothetical protein
MSKSITILGTYHEIQGAEKRITVYAADPFYPILLNQLLNIEGNEPDFVFEEVTGLGPTVAERLVSERLGTQRFIDIDPPREKRKEVGIPDQSSEPYMIGSPPNAIFANWQILHTHSKREEYWLKTVTEQRFKRALVILGSAHMLSFAFRLQSAGLQVKAMSYLPELERAHLVRRDTGSPS